MPKWITIIIKENVLFSYISYWLNYESILCSFTFLIYGKDDKTMFLSTYFLALFIPV